MTDSARKKSPVLPVLFFRILFALGVFLTAILLLTALYGHLRGQPSLVFGLTEFGRWRSFARWTWILLTAGFVLRISVAFIPRYRVRGGEYPELIGGALLVGTLLLFRALVAEDSAGIAEASQGQARSLGKQFLMTIDDPALALDRMATRWSYRGKVPEGEWRLDASRMLVHFPWLFIYSRIDRNGVVRWVSPPEAAPTYVGLSVYHTPSKGAAFELAKNSKDLLFSKVVPLHGGGTGFGALAPIWNGEKFNGALSFGIRIEKFLEPNIDPGDYRVTFLEDGIPFYVMNRDGVLPPGDVEQTTRWRGRDAVAFRNLRWTIETEPLNAVLVRHASALPSVILAVGFLLSLLSVALVRLYLAATIARAQARAALGWQEAIVNGSDLAIVSTDAGGIVKSFNPAAERLLGYVEHEVCDLVTPNLWHDPREVINRAEELTQLYGNPISPGFDTLVERPRHGEVERHEWTFFRKDGTRRPVSTSVHALTEGGRKIGGFVWMIEDLTLKKAQALKISEQQALMLHSSKLASLGEMAAGVAHEINNPLLVIAGKVEQVRRLYGESDPEPSLVLKHMEDVRKTVDRIAKIVSGLRSFARDSSEEPPTEASVKGIVEETAALCTERFRNHSIDFEIGPVDAMMIRCRPFQIVQVLLNLLNNAFDAASIGQNQPRWVRLDARWVGDRAEISISDSGDGIPPSLREKIMMPFFTTKEIGKGTGLGLSISQGIIADHGGTLALDPDASSTRFVVRIPLAG